MAPRINIRAELSVGRHALDTGRVCLIAEWLCDLPRRVPDLIELLWDDDPGVANRAADVLERITADPSPALLLAITAYKQELIGLLPDARFIKLRWNLAFVLPRLPLTVHECRRISGILQGWLDDPSSIVKTACLQALADLSRQDPASTSAVRELLQTCGRSGTPAMRARSRHLLKRLVCAD